MPTYKVTAPNGQVLRITGDSPPTLPELDAIYSSLNTQTDKPPPVAEKVPMGVAGTAAGAAVLMGQGAVKAFQDPLVQDLTAAGLTEMGMAAAGTAYPPLAGVGLGMKALRGAMRMGMGALSEGGMELARENGLVPPPTAADAKKMDQYVGGMKQAWARGALGELLSMTVGGLGGKAFDLFDRKGLALLAEAAPNVGGTVRFGIRKYLAGKAMKESDVTGEAFNVVLDAWSRGGMSPTERALFDSGRFDQLAESQLDGFAKEMAGAIDPTTFARMMAGKRDRRLSVASAIHEKAIGQINKQVGGQLMVQGKPALTGPNAGTTAIMGNIGMFPGRNVAPVGGIDADVRSVRELAQKTQFATAGEPGTPLKQIQELTAELAEYGDTMPYLQVDALRKNVGAAIGTVRRYKGLDPAYDGLEGTLSGIYARLNTAQRGALAKVSPQLVKQWDGAQAAFKGQKKDWDSLLMRRLGQAVDANGGTEMSAWLRGANGLTAPEFGEFMALAPRRMRERYRGGYLDDLMFTRSAEVDKTTKTMGLSGKKLLTLVNEEKDRIRAMFPDDPEMVLKLQRFASTVGYPTSPATKTAMQKQMVEMNQSGAVLNLIQDTAAGKRNLQFTVPREALSAVLRSPRASESFFKLFARGAGRTARGAYARGQMADPALKFANDMSEAVLLSIEEARGAAENSAATPESMLPE